MAKVLHVIDQPGPTGQCPVLRLSVDAARQASSPSGDRDAWLLFGGEALLESARSAGLSDAQCRLAPMPRRLIVPGSMRSVQRLMTQADRVECWTPGAAELVYKLGCQTISHRYRMATYCDDSCALIRKAAKQIADQQPANRQATRQRWDVDVDTLVIGLLADRPEEHDMRRMTLPMAFIVEMLESFEARHRDVRLVCHPSTQGRMQAFELAEHLGFGHMMFQDPGMLEPWDTLAGCDLVLTPLPKQAGLSIAWAEALGLPIVAPKDASLPKLQEATGLIPALSAAPRHLAKVITEWVQSLPGPVGVEVSSS